MPQLFLHRYAYACEEIMGLAQDGSRADRLLITTLIPVHRDAPGFDAGKLDELVCDILIYDKAVGGMHYTGYDLMEHR